jgi:hypothetical protein
MELLFVLDGMHNPNKKVIDDKLANGATEKYTKNRTIMRV